MNALQEFIASDAGKAVQGLVIVAFLDFVTGTFAALRDKTFALDALAAFVRKHILGRVAPIASLLVVGYFGGEAGKLFIGGGLAAAAAYIAETAASILGNVAPPKEGDMKIGNPVNPVPED